jgi:hypothetical protein
MRNRPTVGKLVVPYMVDERVSPIDFKQMHPGHVRKCAEQRLCGVCGKVIRHEFAFIGPADGRSCFADPWMHLDCARLSMVQCPFLGGRAWRDGEGDSDLEQQMLARYEHNMTLVRAANARSHRDEWGNWHFEALGIR